MNTGSRIPEEKPGKNRNLRDREKLFHQGETRKFLSVMLKSLLILLIIGLVALGYWVGFQDGKRHQRKKWFKK